jgi:hypothetical protein
MVHKQLIRRELNSGAGLAALTSALLAGLACLAAAPALAQSDGYGEPVPENESVDYYRSETIDGMGAEDAIPQQPLPSAAPGISDAKLLEPNFSHDSKFEFGIYDQAGKRTATAYYRILRQELEGEDVWLFKYTGKSGDGSGGDSGVSENTDCWVRLADLAPIRSTRKLVQGSQVFYKDVLYSEGSVKVRKKYEGQAVRELELPLPAMHYDYESLLWLIPLLDFGGEADTRFNLFNTLTEVPQTLFVHDEGALPLNIRGKNYDTHGYSFLLGGVQYRYFSVDVNGRAIPARIEMGSTVFINHQFGNRSKPKKKRGRR